MKKPRFSVVWGLLMFVLIAAAYAGGYLFYNDYTQKIEYFQSQNNYILKKHFSLQNKLARLTAALNDLKTANRRSEKRIMTDIERVTEEIENWKYEYTQDLENAQKDYSSSIDELKAEIKNLRNINLGEISVEKNTGSDGQ